MHFALARSHKGLCPSAHIWSQLGQTQGLQVFGWLFFVSIKMSGGRRFVCFIALLIAIAVAGVASESLFEEDLGDVASANYLADRFQQFNDMTTHSKFVESLQAQSPESLSTTGNLRATSEPTTYTSGFLTLGYYSDSNCMNPTELFALELGVCYSYTTSGTPGLTNIYPLVTLQEDGQSYTVRRSFCSADCVCPTDDQSYTVYPARCQEVYPGAGYYTNGFVTPKPQYPNQVGIVQK
jgi:hypothetical protein